MHSGRMSDTVPGGDAASDVTDEFSDAARATPDAAPARHREEMISEQNNAPICEVTLHEFEQARFLALLYLPVEDLRLLTKLHGAASGMHAVGGPVLLPCPHIPSPFIGGTRGRYCRRFPTQARAGLGGGSNLVYEGTQVGPHLNPPLRTSGHQTHRSVGGGRSGGPNR